jgi:hypothetical protein
MPKLDIVCATWNMENDQPSNDQIVQFCNGLLKKPFQDNPPDFQKAPDFAVIGLQEAVPINKNFKDGDLVSQCCVRSSAGKMENVKQQGKEFRGPLIQGYTKFPEKCCQHIGIMRRADSPWRIRHIGPDKPIKDQRSEKGAVALVVDIEPSSSSSDRECIRLVFVSTHLDAGKGQKEELEKYINWLNDLAKEGKIERPSGPAIPAGEVSHIGFIMGDLNFRLIPPKTEVSKLPDQNSDDDFWAGVLLDSPKRGLLFQHYDGFKRDVDYGQWQFPIPKENYDSPAGQHPVCFPTYKRFYDDSKQAATYVAAIKGKPAGDAGAIVAIKHLFLEHRNKKGEIEPLWDEDRKAWNIGWLDRIGYVIRNASNSKKITYRAASCWDGFDIVQSDHTPVFMQLTVDVT